MADHGGPTVLLSDNSEIRLGVPALRHRLNAVTDFAKAFSTLRMKMLYLFTKRVSVTFNCRPARPCPRRVATDKTSDVPEIT